MELDLTRPLYVSRQSTTAWRDEDRAMAHQAHGPFTTLEEARIALVTALREEADTLQQMGPGCLSERAHAFRDAAESVRARTTDTVEVDGILWKISNYAW